MKQKMTLGGFLKNITFLSGFVLLTMTGCHHNDSNTFLGDWTKIDAGFAGPARSSATSFQIGKYVYVGLGVDAQNLQRNDFWVYNSDSLTGGFWQQLGRYSGNTHSDSLASLLATFPGSKRIGAVSFAVGGKGYVGLGYSTDFLSDFYQYDPATNAWKKLNNFPGPARRYAISFVINDVAYMGTGYGLNYMQDMWTYNPASDTWTEVKDFGGSKREGAVAFVINNKAYVGFGSNNGQNLKNIYEFDPSINIWVEKTTLRNTDGIPNRSFASAFSVNGKGYIGFGLAGASPFGDMWEFEPTADVWTQRTSLNPDKCGAPRAYAIGFSDGKYGYITTGQSGNRLDDFWKFKPTSPKTDCPK